MKNYLVKSTQHKTGRTKKGDPEPEDPLIFRAPIKEDGARIHQLISECPPLDVNSVYVYLLLTEHFANTCVVVEYQKQIVGFLSAYLPPNRSASLFVWQVAVHARVRGQALGKRMLRHLLERSALAGVQFIETTVSADNLASRSMFQSVAQEFNTRIHEDLLFETRHFGAHTHEAEPLLRLGPLCRGGHK